jgi:hypothetical protein
MAEMLDKLYALQYKYVSNSQLLSANCTVFELRPLQAYQLNKNGEEDEALASLLDLLTKPRLSHYRRGLACLLIVSICISLGAYESNPIDAESFAKHAVNAFREELAGESKENRERIVDLLEQSEAALEDIRRIKVARTRYEEMEDLIRQAKEIVDVDGEFWRAKDKEDKQTSNDAIKDKGAIKDVDNLK